ncbi:MAG: NosD domain-containing protein [bacterium]
MFSISFGTISGTIKDTLNNPVSNALIRIIYGTETIATGTTNSSGKYAIFGIVGGVYGSVTYSIAASRDGFIPQTKTANAKAGKTVYSDFSLWFLPPVITSITPTLGTNTEAILITIKGLNFRENVSARLTKDEIFEIIGNVSYVDTQTLNAIFNLKDVSLGSWSLVVTNIDGQSFTFQNCFFVFGTKSVILGPVVIYDNLGNFIGTSSLIQKGINLCPTGGTVSVLAGTYSEAIYINKSISLIGTGANACTITATGLGNTNTVTFNGTSCNGVIRGFSITGAGGNYSSGNGIYCINGANPSITNNIILKNAWEGIYCDSSSPIITDNTISKNQRNGIGCWNSSSPTITNNTISQNNSVGISSWYSSSPTIVKSFSPKIFSPYQNLK